MGSSLFSIKAELQDIILQLEEGEATDELVAKLGITEDNLKDKIADYLQVIKRYQCDVKECSDEVARVNQIKKTRDNTLRRLKDAVLEAVLMLALLVSQVIKLLRVVLIKSILVIQLLLY